MESAEIPVIDSHHVYVFIEAVQFPFMMDFYQHFQVKLVGRVCQGTAFGRSQCGCDEQNGICLYRLCLINLIGTDDEILSQDGKLNQRSGRAYILQTALEERSVCQNGECCSSCFFVCRRDNGGIGFLMNPSLEGEWRLNSAMMP